MKDGTAGSEGCLGRRIKWCPEDVFEFSHGSTLRWWGTGDVLDLPSCHPPRSRKAMNCMVRSPKQPPRSFRDLLHHGVQHLSQQLPRAAATHCSGAKLTPSSTTKSAEHSGSTHPESPVHEHELGARHSGNRMSEQGNGQRSKSGGHHLGRLGRFWRAGRKAPQDTKFAAGGAFAANTFSHGQAVAGKGV